MLRDWRLGCLAVLSFSTFAFAASEVLAQDDEEDEEYDDEEAAGEEGEGEDEEYDDEEAAGDEDGDEEEEGDGEEGEEGEGEEGEEEEEATPVAPTKLATDRELAVRPGRSGQSGLLRIVTAERAAANSFRVGLHTEYFSSADYLETGDDNEHIGATVHLGWTTPIPEIEAFLAIISYANSNPNENPSLFQVLGDTQFGVKGHYPVAPWLNMGGDLTVSLLNTVGDIGLVGASTGFQIRGLASADFQRLSAGTPLRAHLNLGYQFDNSSELVADAELRRGEEITRIERFALGVNRTDFFNIGLGLDAPLPYVMPFVEWTLGIPVNRQAYSCETSSDDDAGTPGGPDACLEQETFAAFPDRLTLGARILPPVKGLAVDLAIDIGLTGVSSFVRELQPTAPYMVHFAFSYNFDIRPEVREVTRTVERRVEVERPPPVRGRIRGHVKDAESGTAVAGAIVTYVGRDVTPQAAAEDGSFTSYDVDPGEVRMSVRAESYFDGECAGTVPPAGGEVPVDCALRPTPRVGSIGGRVSGDEGPVPGVAIELSGPQNVRVNSGPDGAFQQADLQPGQYTVRAEAEGYMVVIRQIEVRARERTDIDVAMRKRPTARQALVVVQRNRISIRRQIHFETDSATILPDSSALIDEIADTLLRNTAIRKVEIQGHTDNTGAPARNLDLSQRRAEAVRAALVERGIGADRLEARGFGQTRQLVPNITAANRARNRRVDFVIKEQD